MPPPEIHRASGIVDRQSRGQFVSRPAASAGRVVTTRRQGAGDRQRSLLEYRCLSVSRARMAARDER